MCRSPESQGFIYPPPHCVRFQPRSRQSLLGSPAHLCAGYFHTDRCFEAESADEASGTFCLAPPPPPPERFLNAPLVCERKPNTILMLRVQSAAEEMYLCRYTNCFRGYANSLHAEQFMMEDPELLRLLRAQTWCARFESGARRARARRVGGDRRGLSSSRAMACLKISPQTPETARRQSLEIF
jgi:hypothetical protein